MKHLVFILALLVACDSSVSPLHPPPEPPRFALLYSENSETITVYNRGISIPESSMVMFSSMEDSATSVKWSFGDGETSTEPYDVHFYNHPGEYVIAFRILSPWRDSAFATITVME